MKLIQKTLLTGLIAFQFQAPLVIGQTKTEVLELFEKVSQCSGNDNGSISNFNVKTFNAVEVKKAMWNYKKFRGGEDCMFDRIFSRSSKDAAMLAMKHIKTDPTTSACLAQQLNRQDYKKLRALLFNPKNLGVFASLFGDDNENSEACSQYYIDIYRADGTLVKIVFDYTD